MNLHYADPYLVNIDPLDPSEPDAGGYLYAPVRCGVEGSYFTTDPDRVNCPECLATFLDDKGEPVTTWATKEERDEE